MKTRPIDPRRAAVALVALVALASAPRVLRGQQAPHPAPSHGFAARCAAFVRPDRAGAYLAPDDVHPPVAPVDGDALLALVDRSPRFGLGPGYAPRDLVDLATGRALPPSLCLPPDHQCLRREAAGAYARLAAALFASTHERAWVDSAFRAYDVQCAVFGNWAYRDRRGFCSAATVSALPGHSQHQLGTALDVFALSWVHGGPRFREGFGCSTAGRWLAEHAWEHGFVLPYPLHPDARAPGSDCAARPEWAGRVDPRTGYAYEPWHLRYIGVANAARFHAAWLASGPGSGGEITLEQWLRAERGERDAVEPPVCDGCACGGCATFVAAGATGPCGAGSTAEHLGPDGAPRIAASPPTLLRASVERVDASAVRVRATVRVPDATLTQTPVASPGLRFGPGRTIERLALRPGGVEHAYPALAGAWVLGAGPERARALPWRAALVETGRDDGVNGTNARIPAAVGEREVVLEVDGVAPGARLRVALVGEGGERDARSVTAP